MLALPSTDLKVEVEETQRQRENTGTIVVNFTAGLFGGGVALLKLIYTENLMFKKSHMISLYNFLSEKQYVWIYGRSRHLWFSGL